MGRGERETRGASWAAGDCSSEPREGELDLREHRRDEGPVRRRDVGGRGSGGAEALAERSRRAHRRELPETTT